VDNQIIAENKKIGLMLNFIVKYSWPRGVNSISEQLPRSSYWAWRAAVLDRGC